MKTKVRGLARLLFAAFLLIVTQTTACGAGVAAVKEKSHYSDATADPFIYSEMVVDGPFVMFTTNGRVFTVEGSRLAGKVDILSSMPYNITNQNELGVLRRSLKGIQDFSTKCPKGAPLLAAHTSSLENAIKDFESGKVRSNGVWMTKEEYVQVQAKQKKDLADKIARKEQQAQVAKVAAEEAEAIKAKQEAENQRQVAEQQRLADLTKGLLAKATKDIPFMNSLGLKFVPVKITGGPSAGQQVLFSIWETRVQDYRKYADAKNVVDWQWKAPSFARGEDHPVVNVSWENAVAFCEWLTEQEHSTGKIPATANYRLPTDHEWSCAVGIGDREDAAATPFSKDDILVRVYPWGTQYPPPKGAGNYAARLGLDTYEYTSPVGSFPANANGLHDLGGNAWEWCEDLRYRSSDTGGPRTLRGGSWFDGALGSAFRSGGNQNYGTYTYGFRVVLVELRQEQAAEIATRQPASIGIPATRYEAHNNTGNVSAPRAMEVEMLAEKYGGGETGKQNAEKLLRQADIMATTHFGRGEEGRKRALELLERTVDGVASGFAPNMSPAEARRRYGGILIEQASRVGVPR